MKASFWHDRWEKNEIGFHGSDTNPLLVKYFEELGLAKNNRIFLPLCGKTLDISWLLSKGYKVVGAELSELAVKQMFENLDIKPIISKVGELVLYQANNLDIFVGDIFDISAKNLGLVDAIYDRAALVALPLQTRAKYITHLMNITRKAPQLLLCYEYDQKLMDGPPFSVSQQEVKQHYDKSYDLKLISSVPLQNGMKGKVDSVETVWLLQQ